jgi:tetratricopeptide (TPR) repeat protein
MKDAAPPPRRIGPLITAGVIFCLLTALAYAAWRTCAGPTERGLVAQEPEARLGTLTFPNSGGSEAQREFLRGVLLLHSFEYDAAAGAFRAAQARDPGFAMAYWGEAMTLTHPLWNQQDAPAARVVLARLGPTPERRAARAGTDRERMYLAAVEVLYGEGEKAARDTLYAHAMGRLVAAHPGDDEARAFRALALMGLSQGVRDVPTYVRAGAEALELHARNPDHPGAAHYVIHAFDDPVHAPLALPAARAYSRIAPGAAHAQHMTTHIFLALGMWDDVVAQNIVASGPDSSRWRPGHYTSWLGYGLLQQGKFDAARAHVHRLRDQLGPAGSVAARGYLVSMRADYVVNAERWDAPELAWELAMPEAGWLTARAADFYARGAAALRQGHAGNAEAALSGMRRLAAQAGTGEGAELVRAQVAIMGDELEAQLRLHRGDTAAGLDQLRAAAGREAALPAEFGPPSIVKPTWELLGEVLLALGRAREAQAAFERALELQPGRILSLKGLAEAAQANGDATAADRAVLLLPRGVGLDP